MSVEGESAINGYPRSLIWLESGTMTLAILPVDKFGRERVRWAVRKMIASDLSGLSARPL